MYQTSCCIREHTVSAYLDPSTGAAKTSPDLSGCKVTDPESSYTSEPYVPRRWAIKLESKCGCFSKMMPDNGCLACQSHMVFLAYSQRIFQEPKPEEGVCLASRLSIGHVSMNWLASPNARDGPELLL